MLIAQLTDTHVQAPGVGDRAPMDHNRRLVEAVESLNGEHPRPDLVLATGDMTNDGAPEELTELVRLLEALTVPLAILPGNHDDQGPFRDAFDMPWADGHLSWLLEFDELSIIGLDCTVPNAGHGLFDEARAQWLAQTLEQTAGRPTLLALHHPPFTSGIAMMDRLMLHNADAFVAMVAPAPHVERVVCGHLHRPATAVLPGPDGQGSVLATSCLSTVAHPALNLDPDHPFEIIEDPAGYQLHRYDGGWLTHTRYIATGKVAWNPFV
ncbi:MAG: phosphodiesterase [Actinomycetota bacterium]